MDLESNIAISTIVGTSSHNIFYEIETSNTGLYNNGLGAQSTGGGRPPFWRKTFKNDGQFGFGSPCLPPLLRKSGSAPGLL